MRILLGVVGVIAACVFIGQSATTLGWTAFGMAPEGASWWPWLFAAGAACVVVFEGIALVFAGHLWRTGQQWLAAGCCLLLIAAAIYTVRLELAYHVTGQADKIAERQAATERREAAKADLVHYREQRAQFGTVRPAEAISADIAAHKEHPRWESTSGCTDATVPKSEQYCIEYRGLEAELATAIRVSDINEKIAELEQQRSWVPVNAGAAPDAAWASRTFGGDEQGWQDALMVLGILFWVLARTLALPIAVGAMAGARREDVPSPVQAAHDVQEPEEPDLTNVVRLPSTEAQQSDDLVAEAVDQARSEGHKEIAFADLMERIRVLAQDRDVACPYENSVGMRIAELGFRKKRIRDGNTQRTVYALGSGGAQKALAHAA
jgi:hypothetical protein